MTLKNLEQLLLDMQNAFDNRCMEDEKKRNGLLKKIFKLPRFLKTPPLKDTLSVKKVKLGIGETFHDAFPDLPNDGWGYVDKNGVPAVVKISVDDINQNGLSDCYLLSPLMTIADTNPEYITTHILKQDTDNNGNIIPGKYVVIFRGQSSDKKYIWTKVHVDSKIDNIQNISGPDGDIWVSLIEKAYSFYRKTENSFSSINYGYPGHSFSALGLDTKTINVENPSVNINNILNALKEKQCITLCTGLRPIKWMASQHAYGVRSIDNQIKDNVIIVRNPWGNRCKDVETELSSTDLTTFYSVQVGIFPKMSLKRNLKLEVKPKMLYTLPNNKPYHGIDAIQVGGKYNNINNEKCVYYDNIGDSSIFIIKVKQDISYVMTIRYASEKGAKLGLDISGVPQESIIANQTGDKFDDINIQLPILKTDVDGVHFIKLYAIIPGIFIHSIKFT